MPGVDHSNFGMFSPPRGLNKLRCTYWWVLTRLRPRTSRTDGQSGRVLSLATTLRRQWPIHSTENSESRIGSVTYRRLIDGYRFRLRAAESTCKRVVRRRRSRDATALQVTQVDALSAPGTCRSCPAPAVRRLCNHIIIINIIIIRIIRIVIINHHHLISKHMTISKSIQTRLNAFTRSCLFNASAVGLQSKFKIASSRSRFFAIFQF